MDLHQLNMSTSVWNSVHVQDGLQCIETSVVSPPLAWVLGFLVKYGFVLWFGWVICFLSFGWGMVSSCWKARKAREVVTDDGTINMRSNEHDGLWRAEAGTNRVTDFWSKYHALVIPVFGPWFTILIYSTTSIITIFWFLYLAYKEPQWVRAPSKWIGFRPRVVMFSMTILAITYFGSLLAAIRARRAESIQALAKSLDSKATLQVRKNVPKFAHSRDQVIRFYIICFPILGYFSNLPCYWHVWTALWLPLQLLAWQASCSCAFVKVVACISKQKVYQFCEETFATERQAHERSNVWDMMSSCWTHLTAPRLREAPHNLTTPLTMGDELENPVSPRTHARNVTRTLSQHLVQANHIFSTGLQNHQNESDVEMDLGRRHWLKALSQYEEMEKLLSDVWKNCTMMVLACLVNQFMIVYYSVLASFLVVKESWHHNGNGTRDGNDEHDEHREMLAGFLLLIAIGGLIAAGRIVTPCASVTSKCQSKHSSGRSSIPQLGISRFLAVYQTCGCTPTELSLFLDHLHRVPTGVIIPSIGTINYHLVVEYGKWFAKVLPAFYTTGLVYLDIRGRIVGSQ